MQVDAYNCNVYMKGGGKLNDADCYSLLC